MKTLFVAAALLLPALASAGSWSTYQGDASHTGFVPVSLAPPPVPPLRWVSRPFAAGIQAEGLAIGAGRVFVTPNVYFNESAPLVSLDLKRGRERWRVEFGRIFSVNPPALDGQGKVYLATGNHTPRTFLRAYDSETGAFQWRTAMEAQWERYLAPTIVGNQVASNGGYYGGIYAFDPASGDSDFHTPLPQCDQTTPVPWRESWVMLTTRIDIIDRVSGAARSFPIPSSWSGCVRAQTPVVLGDTAYFTLDGRLVAMDLDDGTLLLDSRIQASGQISTDGSRLYLVSGGAISVRDLAGNPIGSLALPDRALAAPLIVTETHVIARVPDEYRTAILDLTGQQPPVLLNQMGSMALVRDQLLIGTSDGVHAYQISEVLFADGFD